MKNKSFSIMAALFLALAMWGDVYSLTALEIIEKSEKAIRGDTQAALYDITIKTRKWTRTIKLKSFENRLQKKSFSEIYDPAKDAGNRFLLIDKSMWHYVPALQQTVKISPSMMLESWMGSDFTNDDIVKESSIVVDYTHELTGNETVDGQSCYRIELTPKPDAAVVWGKIIYFAREEDCLPVREEFYNEHGIMKKVLSCGQFALMGGRVIPTVYKMQTAGKEDQYTLMEIRGAAFDTAIPDAVFTLQNLTRR